METKTNKIKVLNCYAGVGGNRKYWDDDKVEVTAVEINPEIAAVYQALYPNDKVIVGDAHQYLLDHHKEFDFIWTSPPCQSHTKLRTSHPNNVVYPDMRLYQEIILLEEWFKGAYCVENVEPYYLELKKHSAFIDRHYFWANFDITEYGIPKANKDVSRDTVEGLTKFKDIDLSKFEIKDKRLLLRNAVHPKLGQHILMCAFKQKQNSLRTFI